MSFGGLLGALNHKTGLGVGGVGRDGAVASLASHGRLWLGLGLGLGVCLRGAAVRGAIFIHYIFERSTEGLF